MFTVCRRISILRISAFIGIVTMVGVFAVVAAFSRDGLPGSGMDSPNVTSVSQVSRDGVSKSNLLTDDSSLYVTERQAGQNVIAKVSLQGADRQIVPSAFSNLQALDLSPDRTRLLVSTARSGSADREFWTLPVVSGTPKRVGNLTGRDATWSADGKHLAFGKGPVLYTASATGTQMHELFTASGPVYAIRFSPDGQRIRFTVGDVERNTTALWEVGHDGSKPHVLFRHWPGASNACCGRWTTDGRYYIFQRTQQVQDGSPLTTLWALPDSGQAADEATTLPIQLTSGPISFGHAVPASDNKTIWATGVKIAGEAVKYDLEKKEYIPVAAGVSGTDLDFTSDGKWVAYVAIPEGTLWRCRADGSERLQLNFAPAHAALPHWSPDGKRIAYADHEPGQQWRISVIAADGGTAQPILEESRGQLDSSWAPDNSNRIMFGYMHDAPGINIRIVDLTTHKTETVPGSDGLFSPRWSPDGRYIAALTADYTTVRLFDFQNQQWTTWITEPAGAVSYLFWSADSQYLYYDDSATGEEAIRRVKIGETQPQPLFAVTGIERYPGPFGIWSSRTNDGSLMFVRDRSTQEIYRLTVELP